MKFSILFDNSVITEKTKLTSNGVSYFVSTNEELCKLIKRLWCKATQSKNFQDWADDLNADGNFEGEFTRFDGLDNLSNTITLNIDGKYVPLYQFFIDNVEIK